MMKPPQAYRIQAGIQAGLPQVANSTASEGEKILCSRPAISLRVKKGAEKVSLNKFLLK